MSEAVVCQSGADEHVRAGNPGGGDDTAMVLTRSHHRQKQTAPQKPGGGCCWVFLFLQFSGLNYSAVFFLTTSSEYGLVYDLNGIISSGGCSHTLY